LEDYQRFLEAQKRLSDIDAENKRALEAKENERLKVMAEKGQAEQALAELREKMADELRAERERANALEAHILNGEKTNVITGGLLGTEFVSEAAANHVRMILEPRFEAVRDAAGKVTVRDKQTLKPATEVIKEWLSSDEAAHFRKASTQGGAGAKGTDIRPSANPGQQPTDAASMLIELARTQHAQRDDSYFGLARSGVH
jgi:hypothetical protein